MRVEVILVRPGRAKVTEVDTVGDDPRHLFQVTAYAIPCSLLGLGNPDPMRRQIRGQRGGVGQRRIGLGEHDPACGEEIRQLALEGPDGEVSFASQYRDQGLPEVASSRPDGARNAADREERLRLCRMVDTAAEAITSLCGEGSEPTVAGWHGEPRPFDSPSVWIVGCLEESARRIEFAKPVDKRDGLTAAATITDSPPVIPRHAQSKVDPHQHGSVASEILGQR